MNFKNLIKSKLMSVLPKEIKDTLLCFAFVNTKAVDEGPDIATCNTNGYMYEIKNKRIRGSLNIEDSASTLSCYYLSEKEKVILFYLVFTINNRLLIIRRTDKNMKVIKEYQKVKGFQVYDFKCLGFPQIKLNFLNYPESIICEFPIESHIKETSSELENSLPDSLMEELQDLYNHIDILTEEYNHLRKICFYNNAATDIEKISIGSPHFSFPSSKLMENKLKVGSKWFKVFGSYLILGMTLHNISNEIIDGPEIIISHKKIKNYTFSFFPSFCDINSYLFSDYRFDGLIKSGEWLYAVVSFKVPEFYSESDLSISCYVASKSLKDCSLIETFEVNVCDIALQTTVNLEEHFTVEALLAVLGVKSETRFKIQTEDLKNESMESLLMEHLGFKLIKHLKNKFFYCTSTYLKEVFVALKHIAVNPSVWKMVTYTSEEQQIYFLVNVLYDLLPENSAILCDENINETDIY